MNVNKELNPCPFCGKKPDLDDQDTLYPSGVGWMWDEELQMRTYHSYKGLPREQWCWAMHCPENSCDAEIHGDSEEEAIAKWNRRYYTDVLEENARLKEELAKLRQRAEAMAQELEDQFGLPNSYVDAYRADFPEA